MTRHDEEPQYVDVECTIQRETEKAYLLDAGDEKPVWVPKSQVGRLIRNGTTLTMEIAEWFAEKEGLV